MWNHRLHLRTLTTRKTVIGISRKLLDGRIDKLKLEGKIFSVYGLGFSFFSFFNSHIMTTGDALDKPICEMFSFFFVSCLMFDTKPIRI